MSMKAVSVAIDGLAIIAASTLTAPVKAAYLRGWATWEEWCKEQDLNLVDVTDDDIVRFGDTVAGLTPRQRSDFCLAVLRVYKEVGRESFAKSSKVRDLLSALKAEFLGIYPAPPVAGKTACANERWVRRFVAWCEANDKQALPAAPEDVAAFWMRVPSITRMMRSRLPQQGSRGIRGKMDFLVPVAVASSPK